MARQGLLTCALLLTGLATARANADNVDDDDLRRPHRLTVGVADDLLGQLGPDGETLYYVSNRDTTAQLFTQNIHAGRARQLFDEGADITWPRISPRGRALLYISFRENAAGQLCTRRLPDGDERTCLQDAGAALQAEWIDDQRIVLVSRQSIQGDLRVLEVSTQGELHAKPLLVRNLTSPAVSPDGRWLVYVPVARTVQSVGPAFAAHAAQTLEAIELAAPTKPAVKIELPLPGQTGQPVFGRDGHYLYIVQFFTDTNHDGTVDASDRGVLFRVPLSFAKGAAVIGAPEQLTDTGWNCEYPAPHRQRLIATCSQSATLDVYSLPLDGEVPSEWTMPMLRNAIADADTLVNEQLLTSHWLARETSPGPRRRAMLALAMVHYEREEFRAAEYYATQTDSVSDAASSGIALPLRVLIDQRRAERRREQGRLIEGFRREAEARLAQLPIDHSDSPMAEDITHLARSAIFDSLGDAGSARRELEAVTIDETTPVPIVEVFYRQADAFYRMLDDREALVALCRELARDRGLTADEQLHYARAAVRAMVRGVNFADADARLARERASVTDTHADAELGFAIDLMRDVLAIRDAHAPAAVSEALLALYGAQTRPGRRRALIVDAVQRADEVDADDVLDALVQRDIHDVKPGTHERGEAEDVYERLILARAYERLHAQRHAEARDDFDSVADQTGSLEALVGAIDMRLVLREPPQAIMDRYEHARMPVSMKNFAKAYLLARRLPVLDGAEHQVAAAQAISALSASWLELIEERMAQALFGALLHEEYLQTGELGTAERADAHYLVALELVGDRPRFRAMILGELGLLHTDVGNYRIALGYLTARDELPYVDDAEALDMLLSKSQALLHVGRDADAAAASDAALALIARNPGLARYRMLALDWAGVDNLSAGRFERALALYDQELPMLGSTRETAERKRRNRVVMHISRAAAAIGARRPERALADLDEVDRLLGDAEFMTALQWPRARPEHVARAYHLIASGLRANAERQRGRLSAEHSALARRSAILDERLDEIDRVEIERQQMLVDAQLAWNAGQRRDVAGAGQWLGRAVWRCDDLRARSHGELDREQLDVLWLAAQVSVALATVVVDDLPQRLAAAAAELASRRDPALRAYLRWFEIYLPLLPRMAAQAKQASAAR